MNDYNNLIWQYLELVEIDEKGLNILNVCYNIILFDRNPKVK